MARGPIVRTRAQRIRDLEIQVMSLGNSKRDIRRRILLKARILLMKMREHERIHGGSKPTPARSKHGWFRKRKCLAPPQDAN